MLLCTTTTLSSAAGIRYPTLSRRTQRNPHIDNEAITYLFQDTTFKESRQKKLTIKKNFDDITAITSSRFLDATIFNFNKNDH